MEAERSSEKNKIGTKFWAGESDWLFALVTAELNLTSLWASLPAFTLWYKSNWISCAYSWTNDNSFMLCSINSLEPLLLSNVLSHKIPLWGQLFLKTHLAFLFWENWLLVLMLVAKIELSCSEMRSWCCCSFDKLLIMIASSKLEAIRDSRRSMSSLENWPRHSSIILPMSPSPSILPS